MPPRTSHSLLAATAALMLGACAHTPTPPLPTSEVPVNWQAANVTARVADGSAVVGLQWWQSFGSAELDRLMQQALSANHDLGVAIARIEQARASARIARSALLPTVSASASASHKRQGESGATRRTDSDQAIVGVGYELDLWGGNRAAAESARAQLAATEYARDSVALVLQSEVAVHYFTALALQDRLRIAQENLATAHELMKLVQVRFDNGAATALDLAQQRTTLLSIEAEIPSLQQSLSETQHALAVLTGRPPQGFTLAAGSLSALRLPQVDAGQPTDLLQRRPDIRSAEASLAAAEADVAAARAALFPSAELSASAGISGLVTGGSSTVASLAASLAQTLFDGGSRRAQVASSQARRVELVETYAQTVLTSLQEVEDSLVALSANQSRAQLLQQSAEQANEAYRLALVRFEAGSEDLLTLLDSQRSKLSAEDKRVQAELARFTASVGLFKALSGGWASGSG